VSAVATGRHRAPTTSGPTGVTFTSPAAGADDLGLLPRLRRLPGQRHRYLPGVFFMNSTQLNTES
jgi:hypothetical protein